MRQGGRVSTTGCTTKRRGARAHGCAWRRQGARTCVEADRRRWRMAPVGAAARALCSLSAASAAPPRVTPAAAPAAGVRVGESLPPSHDMGRGRGRSRPPRTGSSDQRRRCGRTGMPRSARCVSRGQRPSLRVRRRWASGHREHCALGRVAPRAVELTAYASWCADRVVCTKDAYDPKSSLRPPTRGKLRRTLHNASCRS